MMITSGYLVKTSFIITWNYKWIAYEFVFVVFFFAFFKNYLPAFSYCKTEHKKSKNVEMKIT